MGTSALHFNIFRRRSRIDFLKKNELEIKNTIYNNKLLIETGKSEHFEGLDILDDKIETNSVFFIKQKENVVVIGSKNNFKKLIHVDDLRELYYQRTGIFSQSIAGALNSKIVQIIDDLYSVDSDSAIPDTAFICYDEASETCMLEANQKLISKVGSEQEFYKIILGVF